jgi:hypothetical protein
VLTKTVRHAKGSSADPLSDAEIEAKLRDSAAQGHFAGRVDDAIAAVWELDTAATIGRLVSALV